MAPGTVSRSDSDRRPFPRQRNAPSHGAGDLWLNRRTDRTMGCGALHRTGRWKTTGHRSRPPSPRGPQPKPPDACSISGAIATACGTRSFTNRTSAPLQVFSKPDARSP
jgi:hypothetical protein